jgi:hypothetical protein
MHEASLMANLMRQIDEVAQAEGASRVIGAVEPDFIPDQRTDPIQFRS